MDTFKEYQVVVTSNGEEQKSLIQYASAKGVPVYCGTADELEQRADSYHEVWPNLIFVRGELCGNRSLASSTGHTWISVEQFKQYCDNWAALAPFVMRLTDSYSAKVSRAEQVVIVGCQTIPFAKIKEVYNACFGTPVDQPVITA
jgi:hypothetical protein